MRILLVSSSSGSRGGGELFLLYLAEYLSIHHKVALWASDHPRMNELCEDFRFGKVFRGPYKNTYDYPFRAIHHLWPKKNNSLLNAIKEFRPDIIHLNKQNLEDGLDLIYSLTFTDIPSVGTIHITQTQKQLGAVLGVVRDWVARKFVNKKHIREWTVVSDSRKRDLLSFVKTPIETIVNGVAIHSADQKNRLRDELRSELNINDSTFVGVGVGRLESQKNPLRFISWCKRIKEYNQDSLFFWVGDGSMMQECLNKSASEQLDQSIFFLGWKKDPSPYLAMANIYLHPANYEGLPFSLLEAMSWGLPGIVHESLLLDMNFPEGTLISTSDDWKSIINNRNYLDHYGEMAMNTIATGYSIKDMAEKYVKVYQRHV